MSEFSDSLHVVDGDNARIATALRALGVTAAILPRVGRHVTVLAGRTDLARVRAALGLVILYEYAADHGISAALFRGDEEVARIARSFENTRVRFDARPWIEAGVIESAHAREIEAALESNEGASGITVALGLHDVDWLSGRDVTERLPRLRERFPGVTVVGVDDYAELGTSIRVLCAMSPQRQQMLKEEPELVDDLLDARHEQAIPGLVDLGMRTPFIAQLLGKELAEAVIAATAVRVLGAPHARLFGLPIVKRFAEALGALDQDKLPWEALAARARRTQQDLDALVQLYTDAAAKGFAVLVVTE